MRWRWLVSGVAAGVGLLCILLMQTLLLRAQNAHGEWQAALLSAEQVRDQNTRQARVQAGQLAQVRTLEARLVRPEEMPDVVFDWAARTEAGGGIRIGTVQFRPAEPVGGHLRLPVVVSGETDTPGDLQRLVAELEQFSRASRLGDITYGAAQDRVTFSLTFYLFE